MADKGLISRLMDDPQQERAFLAAAGFTGGFAACRGVTHAIRRNIPPFHNFSSKGGTHIHHSTFGIFGLLGIGFLWAQQIFTGHDDPPRWGSRVTSTVYGLAAALTLDEFALWLDLHDDYWDAKGRKSIDAVAVFGGLMSMSVIASEMFEDVEDKPAIARVLARLDVRRALPQSKPSSTGPTTAPSAPDSAAPSAPDSAAPPAGTASS
jgi:hypothetical protein